MHHTSQPAASASLSTTNQPLNSVASSSSAAAAASSQPLDYSADFDPSGAPTEVHRVPVDQLSHLSDEQKNEVFTKTITAANPQLARALTRFDYGEGGYKGVGGQSQLAVHFAMDGVLIHVESDEAKEQKEWLAVNKDRIVDIKASSTDTAADAESSATPPMSPSARTRSVGAGEEEEEDGKGGEVAAAGPVNDKALKNQFNYSERGNQTINSTMRDREVVTEPPPCVTFGGQVTHWEIFDTYCDALDKEISQRERNEKPKKKQSEEEDDEEAQAGGAGEAASGGEAAGGVWARNNEILASASCQLALKTMERLVNQNAEAAAFHDYRYHDDPSSLLPFSAAVAPVAAAAAANGTTKKTSTHAAASALLANPSASSAVHASKGPFLPLWKFSHPDAKSLTVTSIAFNPHFSDLFAVAYGSYDFGVASGRRGLVAVYTLKNVSYPEYIMEVAGGGVLSADWHATYPWLLVVGCYDGNVSVLDVRAKKGAELLYSSDNPRLRHTDCVWQVRWSKDDAREQPLHFYSVSADGRVSNWMMKKNELQVDDVLRLTPNQPTPATPNPPPTASSSPTPQQQQAVDELLVTAGGSCFDFNAHLPHLFLLGTEEGGIHLYSKAYNTAHVRSYLGHHMAVYSLAFNPFHPGVFLSCSGDWQVKLWEMDTERPVMSFDLGCGVGDVCWSPFDACVFAVVTADGRLRLFDLAANKHEAVGEIKVGKKAKLTRVAFSSADNIVCVGDDRGVVSVVKLTAMRKAKEGGGKVDAIEEVRRLDRLLIMKEREGGRLPAYLRAYISGEERKREGKEKARAAEKAAADKASAAAAGANGGSSPVGSPKAKPMATPRGE